MQPMEKNSSLLLCKNDACCHLAKLFTYEYHWKKNCVIRWHVITDTLHVEFEVQTVSTELFQKLYGSMAYPVLHVTRATVE